MKAASKNRIGALLLALVLALGMGVSFVQGGLVAAEMAVSTETGHPGSDGCDGDESDAIDACLSICASACQCVLPAEPMALAPDGDTAFEIPQLVAWGWPGSPDHGPPKRLILG